MAAALEWTDTVTGRTGYSGSLSNRPADGGVAGSVYYVTDQKGRIEGWDGAQWTTIRQAQSIKTAEVPLDFGPIYSDSTYLYYGEAAVGSSLSSAVWRVYRIEPVTGQREYVTDQFDQVYTNVATVAALF